MKHLFICALALLFIGCSKTEAVGESGDDETYIQPETRTVYFMNGTIDGLYRNVRVMIDPLEVMICFVSVPLSDELNFPRIPYPAGSKWWIECQKELFPAYDLQEWYTDTNYTPFWFCLGNKRIWLLNNGGNIEAEFSRQKRITGEDIDLVLGAAFPWEKYDTDLSQLPIDLEMTVPYDWGMSKE